METRIQNRIKLIQSAAFADPQYKNAMMIFKNRTSVSGDAPGTDGNAAGLNLGIHKFIQ